MSNDKPIGVAYEDQVLNGAVIDNSVIGGTTAAAATFTTMTCTSAVVGGSTLSGTELGYVDGITPGTVEANKAIVPTTNKHIDALVISDGGLAFGAGAGTAITATAAEINKLASVTAGTVAASKAVVVDANKDISELRNLTATNHIVGVGGSINADSGTTSATGGAATLSKMAGVVTSEALTTAAGAAYTLTLTNTTIAATDLVFASVANGTNNQGVPIVGLTTPGSGSCTISIRNEGAVLAFNGTIVISFIVVKA